MKLCKLEKLEMGNSEIALQKIKNTTPSKYGTVN